jgi:hypothetical protein
MNKSIFLISFIAVVASAQSHAQQTWNFTSGAMTVVSGSGPTGPITGYVVLATPLPANGATLVTPTDFSFSTPLGLLSEANLVLQSNPVTQNGTMNVSFSFVTTNGQITAWTVIVNDTWGQFSGGEEHEYLTLSSSSGNNYVGVVDLYAPCSQGLATCYSVEATSSAGTWAALNNPSCPVSPPPPPSGLQSEQCNPTVSLVTPTNGLMQYVSPNNNGNPRECQKPSNTSKSWFIKTTSDGGKTFSYATTLEQLELGK